MSFGLVREKQKYFTENIEAIWASSFKIREKIEIQAQHSVRLTDLADKFACRAICFAKERFSLAFYRRNRLFPLKSSLFYTVKNPNLLVCRLNSRRWIKISVLYYGPK